MSVKSSASFRSSSFSFLHNSAFYHICVKVNQQLTGSTVFKSVNRNLTSLDI